MVSDLVRLAKIALADVDKKRVIALLDCINLTDQERSIVEKTELNGVRIYDVSEELMLSDDAVSLIKRNAMRKIGIYLTQKLQ
ncbi:MAG: hypothetical protein J6S85_01705 [Methanobrevibacter sp.]|nr:hypothetical protein [Methanobrevibacter sp.]MBO7712250.1 hypothetical protein [Methanobrevibacter sp.]